MENDSKRERNNNWENDQEEQLLIENIRAQAKYFLEEAGEFYPFGACINNKSELRPIGLHMDDDFPQSEKVITELETAIEKFLKDGSYFFAAIGIDVLVKNNENKSSALWIKLFNKKLEQKVYDYPYSLSQESTAIWS